MTVRMESPSQGLSQLSETPNSVLEGFLEITPRKDLTLYADVIYLHTYHEVFRQI